MSASCGLCERDLPDGYLCPGDTLALADRLERLPKVYAALGAFLAPAGAPASDRVSSGPSGSRPPVNEAVLDLRYGGIALVLEGWRSALQADRGWGEPAIEGGVERRVYVVARALSMNLDWAAASWPAVGDMAREIREMERAALSIVGALPDRGRLIGQCVAVDSSGVICGATIRHRAGETRLICAWCRTTYGPEDFLMLRHFQPEEAA